MGNDIFHAVDIGAVGTDDSDISALQQSVIGGFSHQIIQNGFPLLLGPAIADSKGRGGRRAFKENSSLFATGRLAHLQLRDGSRNGHILKCGTASEYDTGNRGIAATQNNGLKTGTSPEQCSADAFHTVGNRDGCQCGTAAEYALSQRFQAVLRQGNTG